MGNFWPYYLNNREHQMPWWWSVRMSWLLRHQDPHVMLAAFANYIEAHDAD